MIFGHIQSDICPLTSKRLPWGQAIMTSSPKSVNPAQEMDRWFVLGIFVYIIFHVSTFRKTGEFVGGKMKLVDITKTVRIIQVVD